MGNNAIALPQQQPALIQMKYHSAFALSAPEPYVEFSDVRLPACLRGCATYAGLHCFFQNIHRVLLSHMPCPSIVPSSRSPSPHALAEPPTTLEV